MLTNAIVHARSVIPNISSFRQRFLFGAKAVSRAISVNNIQNSSKTFTVSSTMSNNTKNPFVTVEWLKTKLDSDASSVRVLDCQWHMPHTKRIGSEEYKQRHIAGALHFSLDDCADKTTDIDHMLPKPEEFAAYVGERGIKNDSHVVLYDNHDEYGIFSAPRAWWTFRVFGHPENRISIVEGGFPALVGAGFATTDAIPDVKPEKYSATYNADLVKSMEQMREILKEKSATVLDARGPGRFEGKKPEPREGIKPGHILGARNVPYLNLIDQEKRRFRTAGEVQQQFDKAGVDLTRPVVATCGSGVSACMLALGAYLCGNDRVAVYDGSWTEWYLRAKPEEKEAVPDE